MNLLTKSTIAGIATLTTAVPSIGALFHENMYALFYTGMLGVAGGALVSTVSCLTADSHRKIVRNQVIGSLVAMTLSTAVAETHPHYSSFHDTKKSTVMIDQAPVAKIPANTYFM